MADQIDSSIPQNSESPTLGAQRIREFKADVNTMVGLEHDVSDNGATQGFHGEQVTIKASASIDDPPAGYGRLGAITADGSADLHYKDDANTVTQITRGGKVNLDKNIIANDTPLQADNEAGDGLVDLIKAGRNEADDADVMVISDGVRTDTDAVPLEDTGVANKKYVDDSDAIEIVSSLDSLGAPLSDNQVYQAQTAGLVTAWGIGTSGPIEGLVGSTSSPATVAALASVPSGSNSAFISFLVPKGAYFNVTIGGAGSATVRWTGIGSAQKPIKQ